MLDVGVPRPFVDGWMVLEAALQQGLNALLLPRQVTLLAYGFPVPSEFAFAHGVPAASSMSAVTFAQDRRLRRALLERAQVPIPKGATFSIRSLQRAQRYAERIGYPVVVKEAIGENPARAISDVASAEGVEEAFYRLRLRDPDAGAPGRSLQIAGYAQTRLAWDLDDAGNQVSPARTRFLVEKQLVGQVVRIFSSGDPAPRAIRRIQLDSAWENSSSNVPAGLMDLAARARRAVPGLAAASIDVVTDTGASRVNGPLSAVVEVAERIRLADYREADEQLGRGIAGSLLRQQAAEAGIELRKKVRSDEPLVIEACIEGLSRPASADETVGPLGSDCGIDVRVMSADTTTGGVRTRAVGVPEKVALWLERTMGGFGLDDRATSILVEQRNRIDGSHGHVA